ncbi:MAG TPA: cupin domain-containing protein [Thermoanaerobaculia bacterium]|jgi:putative transcriptional regulator|nr:cupin domain-containing protein [Thermoanaerobaculia bacterium]
MHPSEELLVAIASGHADLPHRVMVEGHLDSCAPCRATLAEISAPGGALLASLPDARPPDALWERLRTRVGALPPGTADLAAANPALAGFPLPAGARREMPEVAALRWHRVPATPGRWAVLFRDRVSGSVLLLGHMPPRRSVPAHLHLGPEDILVLTGGFEDHLGAFEQGDWTSYPPGSEHRPFTEPGEECWTLTRLEKPNLFLGWRGWLQRLRR